jgi:hypothetical protein
VERVLLKALARDRAARYRTALEFSEAYESAAAGRRPSVDESSPARGGGGWWKRLLGG